MSYRLKADDLSRQLSTKYVLDTAKFRTSISTNELNCTKRYIGTCRHVGGDKNLVYKIAGLQLTLGYVVYHTVSYNLLIELPGNAIL